MVWILSLAALSIFMMLDIYALARLCLGKEFCKEYFWYIIFFMLLVAIILCVGFFLIGYTLTPYMFKGGFIK